MCVSSVLLLISLADTKRAHKHQTIGIKHAALEQIDNKAHQRFV